MSRKFLNNCLYSVSIVFKNRSRFFARQTNHDYVEGIRHMVKELHASGYQLSNIQHIKRKHVDFLIKEWQGRDLDTATIKNRLSQLRYLAELIKKPSLLPTENLSLGIGKRSYISLYSKAIHDIDLSKFENPLIRYSVQLQQNFGLRREEAIKFVASYADLGDKIQLKPSWTKGGIGREIPITTLEQRALLDELKKALGAEKSLIPDGKDYAYQKEVYKEAVKQSGYTNLHGLRHAYAQRRYFELTDALTDGKGWHAPFNGGKKRKELTLDEREIDNAAKESIAQELGHSRREVSSIYIGR